MRKLLLFTLCLFAFQTGWSQCGTYPAPFLETFDGTSTPTCWTESGSEAWNYSTNGDYAASNAGDHTGNNGNYAWIDASFPNGATQISTLTSPLVDVSTLLNPALSFWMFSHNTDDNSLNTLVVEIYDGANWNTVLTHQADLGPGWHRREYPLSAFTITGDVQVRFTITENGTPDPYYNDILIDDVSFDEIPNCPAPTNLTATNITVNSADLGWTGQSTMFEMEFLPFPGTPTGSGQMISGTTFNATGLTNATSYQFLVRENCGGDSLILSGIMDGPLPGGDPKVIELYVIDSIPDLSRYALGAANNGGGTDGIEFTFPAVPASAGDYIYVTSDTTDFLTFFGFAADFRGGNATGINGDDAVELFKDSVVIDVFGDINVDGSGEPWDYLDGWAYRKSQTSTNGGTFVVNEWNYSGINALDTCTVVSCGAASFPYGTYETANRSEWAGPLVFTTACGQVPGDSASLPILVNTPVYQDTGSTDSPCITNTIGNPSSDIYYLVVLDPCATTISASTCGSAYDTFLRLLDTNLSTVASNDDDCGLQSQILNFSVAGLDSIYVVVEGFDADNGSYVLDITQNLAVPNAAFNYPQTTYCATDTAATAIIVGDTGGVFTASPGLVLDPNTGMIDIQNSGVGSYSVFYTVGSASCFGVDTFAVNIAQDTAAFAYPANEYCTTDANPVPVISGTQGGLFTSNVSGLTFASGATGEIDLANSTPGTYVLTYTTSGACPAISAGDTITINPAQTAAFSYSDTLFCKTDPNNPVPTISGTTGGTFMAALGASVNTASGEIDLPSAFPGTYSISYTTPGPCPDTAVLNITILQGSAAFSYGQTSYCIGDTANPFPTITGDMGGVFSSASGLPVNATTGEIDLQSATADSNHTVTYVSPGACSDTITITLIVTDCSNSIGDQLQTLPVTVFPVPNAGSFFVRYEGGNLEVRATVYDLNGKLVFDRNLRLLSGSAVEIDLGNVAEGVYSLKLQSDTQVATKRVIVRR